MDDIELLIRRLGKTVLIGVLIVLGIQWLLAQVGPWLPIIGLCVAMLLVTRFVVNRYRQL